MKSKRLTPLWFIVCTCHLGLLALAECGRDLEALEISNEAEMRFIEARAARMEAVEDEEEKPYKDDNAAMREAAVSKHLQGDAEEPSNNPKNATGASQEAVWTVRQLMMENPLIIARCVKRIRQWWRFQNLLCQVIACASGHCFAFGLLVWGLPSYKLGPRQTLEKLKPFWIPALCCLFIGAANLAVVATAWIMLAGTTGDDDLHAILVETRLAVSNANVLPDVYWVSYFLLYLVTALSAIYAICVVLSLIPRLPKSRQRLPYH